MMSRRFAQFALAAVPVLLGVGCSDQTPAAPTALSVDQIESASRRTRGLAGWKTTGNAGTNQASLVWCQEHGPATASADIGPAGGIIAVGNARLILPPGALNRTIRVTATQPGGNNSMVSFEPSGLQFMKPAGLQFDVSGCNVASYTPDIVYLNYEGVIVERIAATYSAYWHQVAAPVRHFSNYALAW